jgi:hypothetical protein
MGRGKNARAIYSFIFVSVIFLLFFLTSCATKGMVITDITLKKDSMVIEVDRREINIFFMGTLYINYKNIPGELYLNMQVKEKWDNKNNRETAIITVDLSDMDFTVFEEKKGKSL